VPIPLDRHSVLLSTPDTTSFESRPTRDPSQVLDYISQTAPVLWVAESDWGYPIVLTLHSLGMALVVGIIFVFDLRILGLGSRVAVRAVDAFFPLAWLGLAVNAMSGTLLFLANYTAFLHNTAFLTKIALLFAAAICTWLLARRDDLEFGITDAARALAAASLLLLLGAITAGRIIGYTSVPE
jgi:hypothetical protein